MEYRGLTKLMIERNCNVKYDTLVGYIEEVKAMTDYQAGTFGGVEGPSR